MKETLRAVKWATAASESQYQIDPSWRLNDISGNRMRKDETQFQGIMKEEETAGNSSCWILLLLVFELVA